MKFKQKKSTKSLSDKIAEALTVKPTADIEDDQVFGTKPQTLSRADFSSSESEDEAAISDFRKRNVNLLSEISKKYEGQVVSRKELEVEDSDSEDDDVAESNTSGKLVADDSDSAQSDDERLKAMSKAMASDSEDLESDGGESDDYDITKFQKEIHSDEDDENDVDENDEEESDDEGEGYDISQMEEPVKEEFEHVKKQNISEEAKKGACVRNQLLVWEGLLEMRIHLQRCVGTANQLPLPETHAELKNNEEFITECTTAKANISTLLDKFLSLQSLLFKNFPETKTLSTKKVAAESSEKSNDKEDSDEEIPSDTDNEEIPSDTEPEDNDEPEPKKSSNNVDKQPVKKRKLDDYEKDISIAHKSFKQFRDSTIQKWNEKTRMATAANIKNAPTNTILQQISYILSDKSKLVRRTQLKRSEFEIVGYTKPEGDKNGDELNLVTRDRKDDDEYIPEIFDDSDFYHQLLRELIECKSADISDPVQLSRQWIALQQMRSKMKRKVDTKATKGRKIKYVVHNKLVNYMAPEKSTTWTDESTNELYNSLFGKMFEQNNTGVNVHIENGFKIKN